MDGEANLPVPPDPAPKNLVRPSLGQDTSSSSSSSSSQEFLRHIQAAFKRHRPLGTMQIGTTGARRSVAPQREVSRSSCLNVGPKAGIKKSHDVISLREHHAAKHSTQDGRMTNTAVVDSIEHASITPPSISSTITQTFDENFSLLDRRMDQPESAIDIKQSDLQIETRTSDGQRKDQPLTSIYYASQDMEWDASNQGEALDPAANNEGKHPNFETVDSKPVASDRPGPSSSLAKIQGQLHEFKNFLNQPVTRCSVVGSSCATTTSVQSTCAPMLNATTCVSRCYLENKNDEVPELLTDPNANPQANIGDMQHPLHPKNKDASVTQLDQRVTAAQISSSANHDLDARETDKPNNRKGKSASETPVISTQDNDLQPEVPLSKDLHPGGTTQPSKPEKHEKVGKGTSVPRKRNYDPDLFFKVNGKLYQRLGKIGSGGSSEVHKVISSDCTIYALKKIKLKGRDYGTAYGFCQEVEYLNKLKGKNNIIQLVDYEVTDKMLLREVMSGTMSIKDGRVRDDAYIYMVLEYGEIDLAHMLSQKWKEIEGSSKTIDENWLRFYWQQILQAVNTIHEERIVHSDLKPANFLLVKGFLKLIDFGIAKAIMSDTTNIQRDSQVGTLSYMSPEAFMCNESDADGNTIKCGRPSDIWSLGCILYQMVYGRTPFAEYKTFWAKFKIITDPNHEITYGPVSNPWLLDLMKKCLAWDRNKRWRIPELLQHPFIVPPIPTHPQDKYHQLSQLNSQYYGTDQFVSSLSSQLIQLATSDQLTSREGQCKLLSDLSNLCAQLQEHLAGSEGD